MKSVSSSFVCVHRCAVKCSEPFLCLIDLHADFKLCIKSYSSLTIARLRLLLIDGKNNKLVFICSLFIVISILISH